MVGPILCLAGAGALAIGAIVHGVWGWPTILPARPQADAAPPTVSERLSVHLLIYGIWAVGFGAVVWRGVPAGMIDVRLPFEREWPVIQAAEWIYLSVYFVPMMLPWLPVTRGALRRYALRLMVLLAISLGCFLLLPLGAPARKFEATSLAGRILAWETGRADFAAASLPSFHVFWGVLGGALLGTRGGASAMIGWAWAVAVAFSCLATGAHAIADVVASLAIFAAVVVYRAPAAFRAAARTTTTPNNAPIAMPPSPK